MIERLEDRAWLTAHAEALAILLEEWKARTITIENYHAELVWQRERLEELMRERGF